MMSIMMPKLLQSLAGSASTESPRQSLTTGGISNERTRLPAVILSHFVHNGSNPGESNVGDPTARNSVVSDVSQCSTRGNHLCHALSRTISGSASLQRPAQHNDALRRN